MKKLITFTTLLLILSVICLHAQNEQLPNGSFENWETKTQFNISYTEPAGWFTLNQLVTVGYPATTIRTADVFTGDSAVLMENKAGPFSDLPGILTVKQILDENLDPDFERNYVPFSSRPVLVQFYFKSYPAANDTSAMIINLTRWNNNKREIVAEALWANGDTVDAYTKAEVPFFYFTNEAPDSLTLIFSSSNDGFAPKIGSKFYLDDFKFVYEDATGLAEANKPGIKLYPNPANNIFVVEFSGREAQVEVYDLTGKKVHKALAENGLATIDCYGWAAGVYQVVIREDSGRIHRAKVVVKP